MKCRNSSLAPPLSSSTGYGCGIFVASAATHQQVTRCSTEFGIDDQIENEIDGEVRQQQEVCESRGGLECAVGAGRRSVEERNHVGGRDENCEENNQSDQCRSDSVSRVNGLLIASIQRLRMHSMTQHCRNDAAYLKSTARNQIKISEIKTDRHEKVRGSLLIA